MLNLQNNEQKYPSFERVDKKDDLLKKNCYNGNRSFANENS